MATSRFEALPLKSPNIQKSSPLTPKRSRYAVGDIADSPVRSFIARWEASGAAERANYALFLSELSDLLGVPRPEPARADNSLNSYVLDYPVLFDDGLGNTTTGFADLYKRGCFVLELGF